MTNEQLKKTQRYLMLFVLSFCAGCTALIVQREYVLSQGFTFVDSDTLRCKTFVRSPAAHLQADKTLVIVCRKK